MAIAIGEGIKKIENNKGHFDFDIEPALKNSLPNYENEKNVLIEELKNLVIEGIREYKEGKIKFRF